MQKQPPQGLPENHRIESRQAFPIITVLLITLLVLGYAQVTSMTNDRYLDAMGYGFEPTKAYGFLLTQNWPKLMNMFQSTFASLHIVQFFANMYFFWVFANHVEQKLGPARAIFLSALGVVVPLLALAWDQHLKTASIFVGPAFLLCSLVGAYLAIPPDKQRLQSWMPKRRGQIFDREQKRDITEAYNRDPMIYVIVFIAVQAGFHFACQGTPWFPGMFPKYDTIALLPAGVALGIGYGMALFLLIAATGSVKDAPLKLSVLRHYRSLIDIDVPHEQALMGTAKSLGLPYEQVRDWVQKDKGKMRVS